MRMLLFSFSGHYARNFIPTMSQHQCTAAGCGLPAKGFSNLCPRHRATNARHGHPEQSGVTVYELQPYRRRLLQRRKDNPSNPAWELLNARWGRVVQQAEEIHAAYAAGRSFVRHGHRAAQQVLTLARSVPQSTIVDQCLSMVLLWQEHRHRFRSERAFGFQLSRRVRGLTDTNAGTYWCHQRQAMRRVYRDFPPKASLVLADWLVDAFGAAGVRLALLELEGRDGASEERKRLEEALDSLR